MCLSVCGGEMRDGDGGGGEVHRLLQHGFCALNGDGMMASPEVTWKVAGLSLGRRLINASTFICAFRRFWFFFCF